MAVWRSLARLGYPPARAAAILACTAAAGTAAGALLALYLTRWVDRRTRRWRP